MNKVLHIMALTSLLCLIAVGNMRAEDVPAKYQSAQSVVDRLVASIGRLQPSAPRLIVLKNSDEVAITFANGEIRVGDHFLDLCKSFGADSLNAMAMVLAHELAHYYLDHQWANKFGSAYASVDWGKKVREDAGDKADFKTYETQADDYGTYYSYSAGFSTLGIGPAILDSIYRRFVGKDELPGYPPLAERKEIAELAAKKIGSLIPYFETANLLVATSSGFQGEHQAFLLSYAGSCYEHIIGNKFASREMYNNLGLVKTLEAMSLMARAPLIEGQDPEILFSYPLLLDRQSFLYGLEDNRGGGDIDEKAELQRKLKTLSLLKEARQFFETARNMDDAYMPALINLACVQDLMGKHASAVETADEALIYIDLLQQDQFGGPATEVKAIAMAGSGSRDEAEKLFAIAEKKGSTYSAYNLAVLHGELPPIAMPDLDFDLPQDELIFDQSASVFLRGLRPARNNRFRLEDATGTIFMQETDSTILTVLNCQKINCAWRDFRFLELRDNSLQTSLGISRGNRAEKLEKLYGKADGSVLSASAEYRVYVDEGLLFQIDVQGKIARWFYFSGKS